MTTAALLDSESLQIVSLSSASEFPVKVPIRVVAEQCSLALVTQLVPIHQRCIDVSLRHSFPAVGSVEGYPNGIFPFGLTATRLSHKCLLHRLRKGEGCRPFAPVREFAESDPARSNRTPGGRR